MSEETTVLEEGGAKVTTARFVAAGNTFAMRNITSVKMEDAGSLRWPIVWAILAVSSFAGSLGQTSGASGAIVPALFFGALAVWQWRKNSARAIVINTSGTKDAQVAYTTRDKAHAQRVLQALNDAIAQR